VGGGEKRTEMVIGAFVLLAVVLLVATIFWGKHGDFVSRRTHFSVRFDDIRGLVPGDPVLVRGIKKGEVGAVSLKDGYAYIKCWIKKDVVMYDDLSIVLENRDPMGAKQISISPGVNRREADCSQVFEGTRAGDINEMMAGFASAIMTADTLLARMRELLGTGRLNTTLTNLEAASIEARELFTENRETIKSTIETLHMISEKMARDSVDVRLISTLAVLDSSAEQMNRIFKARDSNGRWANSFTMRLCIIVC